MVDHPLQLAPSPLERLIAWIKRPGTIVIVGSIIAAGGIVAGVVIPGEFGGPSPPLVTSTTEAPPAPDGYANAWVNPAGAGASPSVCDPTCTYDSTHAYGSMEDVYAAVSGGQTVRVITGSFTAPQYMEYDSGKGTNTITFLTDNGPVYFYSDFDLGNCEQADTPATGTRYYAASYVTFDGGDNRDFRIGDSTHPARLGVCLGRNQTFSHWEFGHVMTMPRDKDAQLYATYNLTFEYSVFGPGCCGSNHPNGETTTPWNLVSSLREFGTNYFSGQRDDVNLTFDHVTFYGNARNVTMWDAQYNSESSLLQFGDAPDVSCTDGDSCHGDCLHLWGEQNLRITNSIFLYCDVQAFYMETQNGGSFHSADILNNYWTMMDEGAGAEPGCTAHCSNWGGVGSHTIWTATGSGSSVGTNDGTINLMGNTFGDQAAQDWGSNNSSYNPTWGTQTINVKGNLGSRIINDQPYTGCASKDNTNEDDLGVGDDGVTHIITHGGPLTINYDYNVFMTPSGGGGHADCGTHVSDYSWATISGWIDPLTGALTSGTSTPNGYVTDSAICTALGRSTPCDAGVEGSIGAG